MPVWCTCTRRTWRSCWSRWCGWTLRRKCSTHSVWHSDRWLLSAVTTRQRIIVCATCCWCRSVMRSPRSMRVSSSFLFWDLRRPSIPNDAWKSKCKPSRRLEFLKSWIITLIAWIAVIKLLCSKWMPFHRWMSAIHCTREYWILQSNNMETNRWHWAYHPIAVWNISWARRPKALDWHSLYSRKPLFRCRAHHFGLCYFLRCYCRLDWDHKSVYWKEWYAHCSTSIYSKDCASNTLQVNEQMSLHSDWNRSSQIANLFILYVSGPLHFLLRCRSDILYGSRWILA